MLLPVFSIASPDALGCGTLRDCTSGLLSARVEEPPLTRRHLAHFYVLDDLVEVGVLSFSSDWQRIRDFVRDRQRTGDVVLIAKPALLRWGQSQIVDSWSISVREDGELLGKLVRSPQPGFVQHRAVDHLDAGDFGLSREQLQFRRRNEHDLLVPRLAQDALEIGGIQFDTVLLRGQLVQHMLTACVNKKNEPDDGTATGQRGLQTDF